jgi:hypothetical protein
MEFFRAATQPLGYSRTGHVDDEVSLRMVRTACFLALALVVALLLLPATAGATMSFTWDGEGPSGSQWSNAANWGGTAPSGKVGTLTFPWLTNTACTSEPQTGTCYTSANNVAGLEANELAVDDGADYFINLGAGLGAGEGLTLGAGGIRAYTSAHDDGLGGATIADATITLAAPQTWTVVGSSGFEALFLDHAKVSGASDALGINLVEFGFLSLNDGTEIEAGDVSLSGAGQVYLEHAAVLDATDHGTVDVGTGTLLTAADASAGSVDVPGGTLEVGQPGNPGLLTVEGNATFSGAGTYQTDLNKAGTAAGSDYSQMVATGNVGLGEATLSLEDGYTSEEEGYISEGASCNELKPGDVDTLITATGSISGTFKGVANGATISLSCGAVGVPPTAEIHYEEHEITATVKTPGSSKAISKAEEAAAKKKAEEEAEAKKHVEEEAAATKKHGEEEAAVAKKKSEEEATTKRKDEEAAATSKHDEEAQTAALISGLIPSGKTSKIAALLKSGVFSVEFKALEAGKAVIDWYEVPPGAKLAKTKAKPILVASGQFTFEAPGSAKLKIKLTPAGKALLKHAKQLKLTAMGVFTPTGKAPLMRVKTFTLKRG